MFPVYNAVHFTIVSAPNIQIKHSAVIPEGYMPYCCAFAAPFLLHSSKADILLHKFDVNGCSLVNAVFVVREKVILELSVQPPVSLLSCMLQGTAEVVCKSIGKVLLYQGQFNLFELKEGKLLIYLNPGIYEWMGSIYSLKQIKELSSLSITGKKWMNIVEGLGTSPVGSHPGIIWDDLANRLEEQKKNVISTHLKSTWIQHKVFETLILVLNYYDDDNAAASAANNEFLLFQGIKSFIDQNLDIPHTVSGLAAMYHLSESRIKNGFAKYYHLPISKYLIKLRMETAEKLVQESGLSLNKIAYMLGYGYPANFTREYKKYHGKLPGATR